MSDHGPLPEPAQPVAARAVEPDGAPTGWAV